MTLYIDGLIIVWTAIALFGTIDFFRLFLRAHARYWKLTATPQHELIQKFAASRVRDLTIQLTAKAIALVIGFMAIGETIMHWWTLPPGLAAIALIFILGLNALVGRLNERDEYNLYGKE